MWIIPQDSCLHEQERKTVGIGEPQSLSLLVPDILSLCYLKFRELWCLISLLCSVSEFQIRLVYLTQCSPRVDSELPEGQKCLRNLYIQRVSQSLAYIFNIFILRLTLFCVGNPCLMFAVAGDTGFEVEAAPPAFSCSPHHLYSSEDE